MTQPPISVTIITKNEEKNIRRAIQSVLWADEILVIDSGSTDQTRAIAEELGARVLENPWLGYGQQKNFAQRMATHDWVLNMDADEVMTPDLKKEILQALSQPNSSPPILGYSFPRKNHFMSKWIRYGGWYPNILTRLAHRHHAQWTEPAVHEQLIVRGRIQTLLSPLEHYGFTCIQDQIDTNLTFSKLGTEDLRRKGKKPSLILLILKPIGKFIETYFIKRGFLDGLSGFIISVNAAYSMFLKYAFLIESQLQRGKHEK